jgi:hypothetical protein
MKRQISTILILFSFLAAQAQITEVTGWGVHNLNNVTIDIPDPGTVDYVIVEAVYKSKINFAGKQVRFFDSNDIFWADLVPVEVNLNYSSIKDDYLGYAQATFPGASIGPEGITLDQMDSFGGIHSFVAYIFRTIPNPGYYSVSDFTHAYMFYNGPANAYVCNLPIATDSDSRDATVKVVLSEMTNDQRRCIIQVSDGYQTTEVTVNTYDPLLGESLNIVPITLMDVPGDVTNISVTVYSPINDFSPTRGDSYITGAITVDVEYEEEIVVPDEYCTLSQGFYGNAGGFFQGYSTYDLLDMLLSEPLVIGHVSGYRFIASTPECVIQRLPGGGPSVALTGNALNCEAVGFQTLPGGRIKNALLAQTITMGLNLRLDENLGDLALADLPFGNYSYFINKLGSNATVGDLYAAANLVLSGSNPNSLNLSKITDGLSKITEHFVECKPLIGNKSAIASQNPIGEDFPEIAIYPNPVASQATIEFTTPNSDYTTIEIYNMLGSKVQILYQGYTLAEETNTAYLNASGYNKGVYLVVMKNGDFIKREKISIK